MSRTASPLNLRAVALGYFTDMGTTQLFGLALTIILLDPGSSSTCMAQRIDMSLVDWMGILWGLFFTGVGGFVAGRLAPTRPYVHAAGSGLLSLLTCFLFYGLQPEGTNPALYQMGLWLTIPLAVLGAHVATWWTTSEE